MFADPMRAQSAIDRLTGNAYDLVIEGQSGVSAGARRFILSLRAVGEGHAHDLRALPY